MNSRTVFSKSSQAGFTLVELVAVSVIVTILAAYAIPRMMGPGEFAVRTAADRLVAALHYAQTLAQRQGIATSVTLSAAAPNLTVLQNGSPVSFQSESYNGQFKLDWHSEVSVVPSGVTITFGVDGMPTSGAGTYSVQENGVTRYSVKIESTGFAYVGG